MNINYAISKNLYRVEKKTGRKNLSKSKYLIIRRKTDHPGLGLFAYYITMLAWIDYALRNDMIPVIDMQNYENQYHEAGQVGKVNTWELFFKQPCGISLEEALATGKTRYVWSDLPEYQPNDSLDFLYNKEMVSYYHYIAKEYIQCQPDVLDYLQKQENEIFGEIEPSRILGVLARGTDYTGRKPFFNPIQPNISEMIPIIDDHLKKYQCDRIFVATEDENLLRTLKGQYGDQLLFTNQKRVTGITTELCDDKQFMSTSAKMRGMQYLASIYLLSKCRGLVAGRTAGTVGAILLADDYKFVHVITKGRYGIEDAILENNRMVNDK